MLSPNSTDALNYDILISRYDEIMKCIWDKLALMVKKEHLRITRGLLDMLSQNRTFRCISRVAQKECNTYDQYFQENEGQNEKVVYINACRSLFQAKLHQDH